MRYTHAKKGSVMRFAAMIMAAVLMLGGAASAHAFNVLLVGENVKGSGAYDGFRLATRERDGHAAEESDGHLGGLDSYIFIAAPGEAVPPDTDILVLLDAGDMPEVIVQKQIDSMALRPSIAWAAVIALDFQRRYLEAYGVEAGPDARKGYYAAQLIDRFVRRSASFIER